ncbi:MAG: tail fiber domain-containing protein [Oligoflexia bacterium]|nr:tail fiber domain-containing protein [Oligoflexia bacterium]
MKTRKRKAGEAAFTLLEVMVSLALVGVVALFVTSVAKMTAKVQSQATLAATATQIRNNLVNLINNSSAWHNTINDQGDNPSLYCLSTTTAPLPSPSPSPTPCAVGGGSVVSPAYQIMAVKDSSSGGANYYTYNGATSGYTQSGVPCNSFSSSGNDACPLQFTVKWQPVCYSGSSCLYPQIFVQITAAYSPVLKNRIAFNPDNYSASFYQGITNGIGCWIWDQTNQNLMYENCATQVGIGTSTPIYGLDVRGASNSDAVVSLTNDGGANSNGTALNAIAYSDNAGASAALNFISAAGTRTAPQPFPSPQINGQFGAFGHDGNGFGIGDPEGSLSFASESGFTPGSGPTSVGFWTKPLSKLAQEVVHIASNGWIGTGTLTPLNTFHVDTPYPNPVPSASPNPAPTSVTARISAPVSSPSNPAGANSTLQLYDRDNNNGFALVLNGLPSAIPAGNFSLNWDDKPDHPKLTVITGTPAGFVGIMNSNPQHSLDVVGDINTTGNLLINGSVVCSSTNQCNTGSSSDARLKKDVQPLQSALEKISSLQGVSYFWKDAKKFSPGRQIGFIAQEVEKIFPEVVRTDVKTGMKAIVYDHLMAPLVEAFKELKASLDADQSEEDKEIDELKARNAAIEARLNQLEKRSGKAAL